MLAGVAAIFTMPIAQYPTIAPPTIQIQANYPGASAKTVEDTVTQVIEQQMSGLDNFLYMSSTSDDSGNATITLTFAPGTNPTSRRFRCRTSCRSRRRTCRRSCSSSACGDEVEQQLADVVRVQLRRRQHVEVRPRELRGVARARSDQPVERRRPVTLLFGSQYAMRIWLDPT